MKKFCVTKYEVHEFPVLVEAEDELDAINRVNDGQGDQPDDVSDYVGATYIEIDETRGMSFEAFVEQHPDISRERVVDSKAFDGDMFPSIRGVWEIDK
jgi:hypothetical protein